MNRFSAIFVTVILAVLVAVSAAGQAIPAAVPNRAEIERYQSASPTFDKLSVATPAASRRVKTQGREEPARFKVEAASPSLDEGSKYVIPFRVKAVDERIGATSIRDIAVVVGNEKLPRAMWTASGTAIWKDAGTLFVPIHPNEMGTTIAGYMNVDGEVTEWSYKVPGCPMPELRVVSTRGDAKYTEIVVKAVGGRDEDFLSMPVLMAYSPVEAVSKAWDPRVQRQWSGAVKIAYSDGPIENGQAVIRLYDQPAMEGGGFAVAAWTPCGCVRSNDARLSIEGLQLPEKRDLVFSVDFNLAEDRPLVVKASLDHADVESVMFVGLYARGHADTCMAGYGFSDSDGPVWFSADDRPQDRIFKYWLARFMTWRVYVEYYTVHPKYGYWEQRAWYLRTFEGVSYDPCIAGGKG